MRNVWPKALCAYAIMSTSLIFTTSVFAQQSAADAFADAQEVLAIERQYEGQKIDAQRALDAAKIALAACANDESAAKINAAAEKAAGKSQAAAGIFNSIGKSADDWGNAVNNLASGSKADAEAEIRAVEGEVSGTLDSRGNRIFSKSNSTVTVNRVLADAECKKTSMLREAQSSSEYARITVAQTSFSDCMNGHKSTASDLSNRLKEANKTMNGAKDLLAPAMTTAIGAGVGALGAHFQMSGAAASSKAQLQNAALARQQCELNVKNQIQDANRQLARFDKLKSQDLMNLALARKAREETRNKVTDPTPTGSGFAGPVDSGVGGASKNSSGGLGLGGATAASGGGAPGGGGGGSGGGGGGGEASWGFGNGKGDPTGGGGLPPQPDAATYSSDGGGGGSGFGGFGGNSEMAAATGNEPGMMDEGYYSDGAMAFGDGGLEVLLARVTRRLTAHAGDLVKLPQQDMGVAKNPNEAPVERQPSSAKPANVDRF